ncbi:MAG: HNH endonuclease [Acidimicrobiaceae bacterium]|nr:HNH endonuclease [Acidimicrobiaceae bacterium]
MVLEDARKAAAAADRMLKAVRDGGVASGELRAALEQTRAFMAAGAAFQTVAAELIARREHHGDGGAEILASSAGLSQREAHAQVATAAALRKVPKLRDAVQSGAVPQANARRLADAITRTGSAAVGSDAGLLAQARSMRPEQFAKTTQRWIGAQQADDGATEYLRQRARRYLKIYDTDDGMVCLHGEFDKITGTRIRNRLRHTAGRLLDADKKLSQTQRRKFPQCMADALQHHTARTGGGDTKAGPGSAETCHGDHGHGRGSRGQSPAGLTSPGKADSDGDGREDGAHVTSRRDPLPGKADSDGDGREGAQLSHSTDTDDSVSATTDSRTGQSAEATSSSNNGSGDQTSGDTQTGGDIHNTAENTANSEGSVSAITDSGGCGASSCRCDTVATARKCGDADSTSPATGTDTDAAACANSEDAATDAVSAGESSGNSASGGWVADITVLAHVDNTTSELIGELSDGTKLPAAVLDELSCNARWAGLVYNRAGDAIWRSRSRRTVTDTQWQALLATYGGCFHCAAPAGMCQAHHITPYSQGGATNLKNLIMVCWNCHHKIHHHNWRIEEHSDGSHTLHPPDDLTAATQPRYGPACADDYPPAPESPGPSTRTLTQKTRARTATKGRDQIRARARDPALW